MWHSQQSPASASCSWLTGLEALTNVFSTDIKRRRRLCVHQYFMCPKLRLHGLNVFSVTKLSRSVLPLQDYVMTKRLAAVFSHCYGGSPVPPVPPMDVALSTQLGNTSPPSRDCLVRWFFISWTELRITWMSSVLRYSVPEQPGDVGCDLRGGRTSVLRTSGAADVSVWTVWSDLPRRFYSQLTVFLLVFILF